ncbi:MAG: hypothetical protein ABEK00_01835 [Candidatus Nanohaloarchaea archaeon]
MEHEFSWRKVGEIAIVLTVLYFVLSPVLGFVLGLKGLLQFVVPFTLLYAVASHGLDKLSERV